MKKLNFGYSEFVGDEILFRAYEAIKNDVIAPVIILQITSELKPVYETIT